MMIDYKKLQTAREDDVPNSLPEYSKPIRRDVDDFNAAARAINSFYKDEEAYKAFVQAVGKDVALKWMAGFLESKRDAK